MDQKKQQYELIRGEQPVMESRHFFRGRGRSEAELPRRCRGSKSWERGETGAEAVTPRSRQCRLRHEKRKYEEHKR